MAARETKIVFCADDFGSDESVDDAIIELAETGKLRAVSVLISSSRFSEERFRALLKTRVEIGVHLALTDTTPLTDALSGTRWIDKGEFPRHWRDLQLRLLYSTPPAELVLQEWRAQLKRLMALTDRITYIDSHQNLHLLPHFSRPMQFLLNEYKELRVRVFFDLCRRLAPVHLFAALSGRWLYRHRMQNRTWGLYASGNLTFGAVKEVVGQIVAVGGEGWIVTHPGLSDDPMPPLRYKLNWRSEYQLLRSIELQEFLHSKGLSFGAMS